jgi:glycosyltransferase involved in cell wall biosynthesis
VYTCYGIGDNRYDDYSQKICSDLEHKVNSLWARISGIPYGGWHLSNNKFIGVVKQYHPDVVHVHCVNAFTINVYCLLKYLARNGIKTVVTLHAEFFHTGSCGHAYDCEKWKKGCHHCAVYRQETASWFFDRSHAAWRRMYKAFQHFDSNNITITAVSPWLTERARQSAILGRFSVVYVPNGVNTEVFHFHSNIGLIDREQYQKVVLFVTPCFSLEETDLKGGRFVPIMAKQYPEYKFIVVASRNEGSIGDMLVNVQLWGRAKTQDELAQLYSEADATILFSKRETFSMVTVESLCCGTPVVGFKAGGPESIALQDYSSFVEYGDVQALADTLDQYLTTTYDKSEVSKKSIFAYSEENMANSYFSVYKSLLK